MSQQFSDLEPNATYVVAVSGGVDSVVLLDQLVEWGRAQLVVAHMNHGIRGVEADQDEYFVRELAAGYKLLFYSAKICLGTGASEDLAREARYGFLRSIKSRVNARAIVTAHHQDDLVETMVLSLVRGTRRRGLTPFGAIDVTRPLLGVAKQEMYNYAKAKGLAWREDSTNTDQTYARNYVRQSVLPVLKANRGATSLLDLHGQMKPINLKIDQLLLDLDNAIRRDDRINSYAFLQCPFAVAVEYMGWLCSSRGIEVTGKRLQELVVLCRTLKPGKEVVLNNRWSVVIAASELVLVDGNLRVGN